MSNRQAPIWTEEELERQRRHFNSETDPAVIVDIIDSHLALLRKEKNQ